VVSFVDIGRIVGHHYLNILFIIKKSFEYSDWMFLCYRWSNISRPRAGLRRDNAKTNKLLGSSW